MTDFADRLRDLIASHLDMPFCRIRPGGEAAAVTRRLRLPIRPARFTRDEIALRDDRTTSGYGCRVTMAAKLRPTCAGRLPCANFIAAAVASAQKAAHRVRSFIVLLGKTGAYVARSPRRGTARRRPPTAIRRPTFRLQRGHGGSNRMCGTEDRADAYRDRRPHIATVSGARREARNATQ
jgi:hypothetical protein